MLEVIVTIVSKLVYFHLFAGRKQPTLFRCCNPFTKYQREQTVRKVGQNLSAALHDSNPNSFRNDTDILLGGGFPYLEK